MFPVGSHRLEVPPHAGLGLGALRERPRPRPRLPRLHVRVCYEPERTDVHLEDNDWLLDESVGLWPVCGGLVG